MKLLAQQFALGREFDDPSGTHHGQEILPAQMRVMRELRRALDSNGVLNPGKMFD